MDDVDALMGLIGDKSKVTRYIGSFVGMDSLQAIVDVSGSRIKIDTIGNERPQVNESVHVWFIDGTPYMLGSTISKPGSGVVETMASGMLTVQTDLGVIPMPYSGTAPTSGQTVKVLWQEDPCAFLLSTNPAPPPPPDPPPSGGGVQLKDFFATDSGSWNGSRWQSNEVWASDSIMGAWVYGTQIADTIPDTATILSVNIYLPALQADGVANIGTHDSAALPDGWTGADNLITLDPRSGDVELPNSFGEYLRDVWGGIAVTSGNGFNRWSGTQSDGLSGRLRIRYSS